MHGSQDGAPAAGGAELLLTSLLVLALVCAVTWIAVRFLRTWLHRRHAATGITILGRIPLEPRRSLVVIDAAGRRLLLASSEAGITLLTDLPSQLPLAPPAAAAALAPPAAAPPTIAPLRFADLVRAAITSRRRAASPPVVAPPPPASEPARPTAPRDVA